MSYQDDLILIKHSLCNLYEHSKRKPEWDALSDPSQYKAEFKHCAEIYKKLRLITISDYKKMFTQLGFCMSKPYHHQGIGNNNEYKITKHIHLPDGYETEAIIGTFTYNYVGTAFVCFKDKDGNRIYENRGYIYYD